MKKRIFLFAGCTLFFGQIRAQNDPNSVILNIKDSVLIGNCFVAIEKHASSHCVCDTTSNDMFYVDGFKNSLDLELNSLQKNFRVIIEDTAFKIFAADVALIKVKKVKESRIFHFIISKYDYLPESEILEKGDVVVFICIWAYKNQRRYSFGSRWYYIK